MTLEDQLRAIVRDELAKALAERSGRPTAIHMPPAVGAGGYIYFAHAAEARAVKIGITRDVCARLKSLRTGSPHEVTLVGAYWLREPGDEEAALHSRFRALRIRNEWFRDDAEILDLAVWASGREWLRAPIEAVVELAGETRGLCR